MVFRRLSSGLYIVEITPNESDSAVTSNSVALNSMSGQMPSSVVARVSRAAGIRSPVSGSAIRLVSMK